MVYPDGAFLNFFFEKRFYCAVYANILSPRGKEQSTRIPFEKYATADSTELNANNSVYLHHPSRVLWPGRFPCPRVARRPETIRRWRSGRGWTEPSQRCRHRRTPALGGSAPSCTVPGPSWDRPGSGRTPAWGSGATGTSAAVSRPGCRRISGL